MFCCGTDFYPRVFFPAHVPLKNQERTTKRSRKNDGHGPRVFRAVLLESRDDPSRWKNCCHVRNLPLGNLTSFGKKKNWKNEWRICHRPTHAHTHTHTHTYTHTDFSSSCRSGNYPRRCLRRHGSVLKMVLVGVYRNRSNCVWSWYCVRWCFDSSLSILLSEDQLCFLSTVSIGKSKDVVLSRSGPKQLNINSAVKVDGTVDVKALKINGKPFSGQCKCSGGGGSVLAPIKESCGSDCKACSKAKIWADGLLRFHN